jgi:hypothetical protein
MSHQFTKNVMQVYRGDVMQDIWEHDASKYTLSTMLLIYYFSNERLSFNWVDILSASLEESIKVVKETSPSEFTIFHMPSYLLEMMCICHQYPNMAWDWQSTDPLVHIYCKVLWEHKYRTNYHRIYDYF